MNLKSQIFHLPTRANIIFKAKSTSQEVLFVLGRVDKKDAV